jgi:Protein of unknown function (DUF3147)
MMPTLQLGTLGRVRAWDYVLRFAFGGAVTVATGVVAKVFGPEIGGLFLAFPAILPASLTLVAQHDGRSSAVDDARGAVLGAIALGAFAIVAAMLARWVGAWGTLGAASAVWGMAAVTAWGLVYGRRAK